VTHPLPGRASPPGPGAEEPPLDLEAARRHLARVREAGVLLETDGLAILDAIGISTPRRVRLSGAEAAEALPDPPLPAERLVLKVLAPDLLHKTEAGGVRVLPARRFAVIAEVAAMERRFADRKVAGYLLEEFVPHDGGLGSEFLLGMRWTRDFGPVVTLGAGGIHAEFLARAFREGESLAVFSPALSRGSAIEETIERLTPARLAVRGQRGRAAALPAGRLADAVRRFLSLAAGLSPEPLAEFEVNPLVVSGGRLVALDALAKLDGSVEPPAPARPLSKIGHLLHPRSIAVVGVSETSVNPGRIILQNVLKAGFDRAQVFVVKPGSVSIDGCRCVPSLAALPQRTDVVVLSVSAAASAELIGEIARERRAEAVVLIPGGLEEKPESRPIVERMREALARSRAEEWAGPVVNGGNCLGVRSVPGRYNTLFIPRYKLPLPGGKADPVALITGSGAFAVSKSSKLAGVNPLYTITIGNQMDLTAGDYLEYLKSDPEVEIFAVYLEGFRPLDGARALAAVEAITASGRTVIFYLGGRTPAGTAAAMSHTAAVASDYLVARALAESAGAIVADTLEDFEDLVRLFTLLRGRSVAGLSLGAVSNAGYESVAVADSLGPFQLARFSEDRVASLSTALSSAGLAGIVTVRNPLDLTPILDDAGYETVVRLTLGDPGVQVGLVGCVPLTGALNTLPAGEGHGEDIRRKDGIVERLIRIAREGGKAWIAVVDAGPLYDPMARALTEGGVPVFRTADRALRLFGRFCSARLAGVLRSRGRDREAPDAGTEERREPCAESRAVQSRVSC
jgi:acyl-CoA synthetase (NDP forming)